VSLTADGISTLLHPGEIASYNRANGETTVRPMGEEAPYWQTGKLNFDNSSLLQITRVLERAYNVRFEVKTDTIGDLRFHGEFDVDNNSIDDIMQVMAATHHLRYRIRGNTVVIY
jgi:ferric-dicitrate binding protein FerR (iron transport regulator)